MDRYQPKLIEPAWQKRWQQNRTYQTDFNGPGQKYYGFCMFNYPSGAGIHVGHVKNFTIPDVLLRIKRQQGLNVYAPVGFDSFGSPTENYALKTGQEPRAITDQAITNYRHQYRSLGFSFDWSKEIDTSQPDYYRWTQWCFIKLFQAGLAYQKDSYQWWCRQCLTVLADGQVINGRCWRHDGDDEPLIGKKKLKQWFFKISAYADQLLAATPQLDWTPWVKTAQINYIGRSSGLNLKFKLSGLDLETTDLTVFTTAIETVYSCHFLVLAPEHPLVESISHLADNRDQIKAYVLKSQHQSDLSRAQAGGKTGVLVAGLEAEHPLTRARLPVYIADYVLAGYGLGAIMAVPGADSRDRLFAQNYQLPISYPTQSDRFIDYSQLKTGLNDHYLQLAKSVLAADPAAGSLAGQSLARVKQQLTDRLVKTGLAQVAVNYHLRDWLVSRQRYWGAPIPIIHCSDCGPQAVPPDQLPVLLPKIPDYRPAGDGQGPLARLKDWTAASCPRCQGPGQRETDTLDGYVCSSWYQFRYLSPRDNQKAWDRTVTDRWLPVDFYNGGDHVTAHLIYARFFGHFFKDQGYLSQAEPFARLYFHGKILAGDGQKFSKSKGVNLDPLDIINQGYGADALRLYVCFMGPLDAEVNWQDSGVPGCFRFLQRCYELVKNFCQRDRADSVQVNPELEQKLLLIGQKHLANYQQAIGAMKFNRAIAGLMALVNDLMAVKNDQDSRFEQPAWATCLDNLVMLLAPFCPHLASELWQQLGHPDDVHLKHWPQSQDRLGAGLAVTIAVTINGRLRGQLKLDPDASQDQAHQAALQLPAVIRHLGGRDHSIRYVPKKIINLIT